MRGDFDEQPRDTKAAGDPDERGPAEYCDPVIEAYKKDVDRTLLLAYAFGS